MTVTDTMDPNDCDNDDNGDGGNLNTQATTRPANRGWGWLVVVASFYCVAVVGGVSNLTGVLMESLKNDLQGNVASISLTG